MKETTLEQVGRLENGDKISDVRGKIIHVGEWKEEEDRFRKGSYTSRQYAVLADPARRDGATVGLNLYGQGDISELKFHVVRLFGGKYDALKCDSYESRSGEWKPTLKLTSSGNIEDLGDPSDDRRDSPEDRDREDRRSAPPARHEPRREECRERRAAPNDGLKDVRKTLARLANLAALCERQALITRHYQHWETGVLHGAQGLAASLRIDALKRIRLEDIPIDIRKLDLSLPEGVMSAEEQIDILAKQDGRYEAMKAADSVPRQGTTPGPEPESDPEPEPYQPAETGDGPANDRPDPAAEEEDEEDSDIPF